MIDTRDKSKNYITIESEKDQFGRQRFSIEWWAYNPSLDCDGWRGQCFNAKIEDHINKNTVIKG
jgi:hypothetical protein